MTGREKVEALQRVAGCYQELEAALRECAGVFAQAVPERLVWWMRQETRDAGRMSEFWTEAADEMRGLYREREDAADAPV